MKKNDVYLDRHKIVRKKNTMITDFRYSLSIVEQRVIAYLICQIDYNDEDFKVYTFDLKHFCDVCGIDHTGGKTFKELMNGIKKLADKSMWCHVGNGDISLIRWIETPTINEKNNTIQLRLNDKLKPYLLNLKSRYASYELIWILSFKHKASIKLYELLLAHYFNRDKPQTITFELDELREHLDAVNYSYRDFRRDILEPAINEINYYTDLYVSYEAKTKGRKVEEIEITVEEVRSDEIESRKRKIEDELNGGQMTLW